ncbi:hypothetical protein JHK87_027053 [Glycine soja]|nr:hypothetical protein JHK87_027053 [Glycine soja]
MHGSSNGVEEANHMLIGVCMLNVVVKPGQWTCEETYKDKKNEDIDDNVIPSLTTGFLGVRKDAKKHGKREGTLKLKEKDNIGLGEEGKLLNDEKVSKEMDDLLACYLTLNAYEYHDLIIKVFWQVWSDMRQGGLGNKLNMQWSYYE